MNINIGAKWNIQQSKVTHLRVEVRILGFKSIRKRKPCPESDNKYTPDSGVRWPRTLD